MTRVVVCGALANRPLNGGGAMVRMSWVRALEALGFEVWFVEQMERDLATDAHGRGVEPRDSLQVDFFRRVTARFGLSGRSALLDEEGAHLAGVASEDVFQVAAEAALLVNLGGHLRLPRLLELFRCKVHVDLDPGYTQVWHDTGVEAGIRGHDAYFTVGLNVGRPECDLPTDGIRWRPLPPPVVLADWSPQDEPRLDAFTTIASWRGPFGRLEHRGRTYGLKAHQFRRLLDLPSRLPAPAEIALDIHPADRGDLEALRRHGWKIVEPRREVPDPESYRAYILRSGAELSAAQGIYVDTRCGWVSDRTACYLAAGRPALVQDTGLGSQLPVGEGLLVFHDAEEAVAGARAIADDYAFHSSRARQLAAEYFDSQLVARRLLDQVGAAP